MTRLSRSNSAVYDDQDENYLPRNHGNVAPHQRLDKQAHDMSVYPEDENDDFLDKENQPAGMVTYEDQHVQASHRHARQQLLHRQQQQQQQQPTVGRTHQQHHSRQFSQELRHPGDTAMPDIRADSGVFEDTRRVGGGGVFDAQDAGSASDQENVTPCPSTPPAAAATAAAAAAAQPAGIVLDARDELLLREKYLAQRQSAKTELMERSRDQRQVAAAQQQRQQQQQQQQQQRQGQVPLARQQSGTQRLPLPTQRDAPGAPMRKRTRKSMEAEELQHQQHRHQQQHPDAQRDPSQAQGGADRHAQDQARRQRARQAQLQNAGHPPQPTQPRDEDQRKRAKAQQQSSQQQLQQDQAMTQREIAFKEKYDKLTQAIEYGDVYCDSKYEYRNVTLPKIMLSFIDRRFMEFPDNPYSNVLRILTEEEWREVGITMSQYWVNWMRHDPEPHVLLFRRPVGTGARMKKESERAAKEAQEEKRRLEQESQNGLGPAEQQPQLLQLQQQQQQQLQQQQHYHHQQQQQH